MTKGSDTRERILDTAFRLAARLAERGQQHRHREALGPGTQHLQLQLYLRPEVGEEAALGQARLAGQNAQAEPVETIARYWRPAPGGSLRVGLRHGLYCLGCCWALMLMLFVTGVMNLLWIAILSALVLAEKLLPQGRLLSRFAGGAILAWGAFLLLR